MYTLEEDRRIQAFFADWERASGREKDGRKSWEKEEEEEEEDGNCRGEEEEEEEDHLRLLFFFFFCPVSLASFFLPAAKPSGPRKVRVVVVGETGLLSLVVSDLFFPPQFLFRGWDPFPPHIFLLDGISLFLNYFFSSFLPTHNFLRGGICIAPFDSEIFNTQKLCHYRRSLNKVCSRFARKADKRCVVQNWLPCTLVGENSRLQSYPSKTRTRRM